MVLCSLKKLKSQNKLSSNQFFLMNPLLENVGFLLIKKAFLKKPDS
jgi:hypothetical protein